MEFFKKLFCRKNKVEVPANVRKLIDALGGINNVLAYNNCVSRLRYDVKDMSLINKDELINLGFKYVIYFEGQNHVQIVYGVGVEEFNKLVKDSVPTLKAEYEKEMKKNRHQKIAQVVEQSKKEEEEAEIPNLRRVKAPTSGRVITLKELNDGVFSEGMVGEGAAIIMEGEDVNGFINIVAPFDGTITMLPANKNQFILKGDFGAEIVVLIGLDSYKLNGIGFEDALPLNSKVLAGEKIMSVNLRKMKEENLDTHLVIAATGDSQYKKLKDLRPEASISHTFMKLEKI